MSERFEFTKSDVEALANGGFPEGLERFVRVATVNTFRRPSMGVAQWCAADVDDVAQSVALDLLTLAPQALADGKADWQLWVESTVFRCARFAVVDWLRARDLVPVALQSAMQTEPIDSATAQELEAGAVSAEFIRLPNGQIESRPLVELVRFIRRFTDSRKLQEAALAIAYAHSLDDAALFAGVSPRTMDRRVRELKAVLPEPVSDRCTRAVVDALAIALRWRVSDVLALPSE